MTDPIRALLDRRKLLALSIAAVAAACGGKRAASNAGAATATTPSNGSRPAATGSARATPSSRPRHVGPAHEIVHGDRSSKDIALTFHTAGDPAVVDAVLRAAHQHGAGLTMLVVGTWLEANPAFAHRILAAGHDIGNHTWSHPVLLDDDATMTRDEVRRCRDLLNRLTGNGGQWFRPSGTPHADPLILKAAGAAGYPTSLSYDVDPLDYTDPGSAAVVERVLAEARGGSIISLHTLYAGTAEALPAIFRGLQQRGLRAVTARQLLGARLAA
jgi:peptidoglycan/xylan/chitin deacetylase (PgdA/CDA1 family)